MGCNCQNNTSENQGYLSPQTEGVGLDFSGFFQRNMAIIFGGDWDKAINTIETRLAWNDYSFIDPTTWGSPELRRSHIERILNAYTNYILEIDDTVQYYDDYKAKKGDEATWNFIKIIADVAGLSPEIIRKVLDQLVWATLDGTIKDTTIWKPKLNKYADLRKKTPDKADSMWNSKLLQGGLSLFNNLEWILPVALIGAGVYVAFPFLSMARNTAKVASGKS